MMCLLLFSEDTEEYLFKGKIVYLFKGKTFLAKNQLRW